MSFSFTPIAVVKKSSFKEKFGTPRQGSLTPDSRAFLELSTKLPTGSTEGLEGFTHLWLIWVFHENTNTKIKGKIFAPRLGGGSTGVLASRSPHRPNPLGLSRVKLESIEAKGLWVSGIDLIENTPILDIKPYIKEDRLSEVEMQEAQFGWPEATDKSARKTIWNIDPQLLLPELEFEQKQKFIELVESTLALDPRPVVYKKLEKEQGYEGPYGLSLGFAERSYNVKFTSDLEGFKVFSVEERHERSD